MEAFLLYAGNIHLSESLSASLAVAEVVLRNGVHRQLTIQFGTHEWYLLIDQKPGLADLQANIDKVIAYILARNEAHSADKVVAELTFGFWATISNLAYENVLWKQLRRAFAHLPKQDR